MLTAKPMEQSLGKSIPQYVKHLSNVLQRNRSAVCDLPQQVLQVSACLDSLRLQVPHWQWQRGCWHFRIVCVFFQASNICWASSDSVGGECATLQKSGFCLAPELLSAAEFRFSHLTLHSLCFHSPGVEEQSLKSYYVPVMSKPSPHCCKAKD